MVKVVCWAPYAKAFEQSIATLLREDFPAGWIAQDVYVGEEQIDVLAILPQGICAIECKAYTGQIAGDANRPWVARNGSKDTLIEPRHRNPYRQALTKAFAVSDLLKGVLQANTQWAAAERPWTHACVVFPQETDLSGLRGVPVDPAIVLPRGQERVLVFHPDRLSSYLGSMARELERRLAAALVMTLGGKAQGTWLEDKAPESKLEGQRRRWQLRIVWE